MSWRHNELTMSWQHRPFLSTSTQLLQPQLQPQLQLHGYSYITLYARLLLGGMLSGMIYDARKCSSEWIEPCRNLQSMMDQG